MNVEKSFIDLSDIIRYIGKEQGLMWKAKEFIRLIIYFVG